MSRFQEASNALFANPAVMLDWCPALIKKLDKISRPSQHHNAFLLTDTEAETVLAYTGIDADGGGFLMHKGRMIIARQTDRKQNARMWSI